MAFQGELAIVGVGLLGGSIGAAARQRGLFSRVVGVCRSARAADRARQQGVVDEATIDAARGVSEASIVVICTPVSSIAGAYATIAPACPRGCVVTDAGSTKQELVTEIETLRTSRTTLPPFVGSHPLAGDHRCGPEAARPDLLLDKTVIVTPTPATDPEALARVEQFWRSLGAKLSTLSPTEHDRLLAASSHLPHLAASLLAGTTAEEALPWTGAGWRDTTRVAAGDPALWADILISNRQNILEAGRLLEDSLRGALAALEAGDRDRLVEVLEQGSARRNAVGS